MSDKEEPDLRKQIEDFKKKETIYKSTLQELGGLNQELRSFTRVISHDLKAPLRGIHSISKWLNEQYENSADPAEKNTDKFLERKKQIELLCGRVRRMHELIDEIVENDLVKRLQKSELKLRMKLGTS